MKFQSFILANMDQFHSYSRKLRISQILQAIDKKCEILRSSIDDFKKNQFKFSQQKLSNHGLVFLKEEIKIFETDIWKFEVHLSRNNLNLKN
jgi:hypothetical protein